MEAGLGSAEVRRLLEESFSAQFSAPVAKLLLEQPELFSAARSEEMAELAEPYLNAALRESYIDVIHGRAPKES
ncbi:MAG TPA: hypothetical protein VL155_10755 [Terriglobales bacterium]|jgi:hypothetical protein|nr:hypothetical protein [Terriglobales bacterium]